jgi:DNA-binding GntR family transcriptional regulator
VAFHRSIVQRAGLRDLDLIWASLVARVRSHFWETQRNYPDPLDIYREHADLVETFRSGNLEKSVEELEQNIA